jgi:hypothetical protein
MERESANSEAQGRAPAPPPSRKNVENLKTTASGASEPQDVAVVRRRPGAQPGNSNALTDGRHTVQMRSLRKAVRSVKRRANAAIASVNRQIAQRKRDRR